MKSPPFILCEPPLSGIPPFYPTQTRGVRSCSACSHAYREAPVRWTGASFFCQFCGGIRGGQSRPPLRRSYGAKRCHCEKRSDAAIRSQRGAAALTGRRGRRPLHSSIYLYTTEAYFSSACPRSGRTAPGCGGAARCAPALSGGDRRPSGSGRRPAPRQEGAYRS